MSDESKPFTVTDRRHFTHDGEVRPTEDERASEEAQTPSAGSDTGGQAQPKSSAQSVGVETVSFGEFLVSLGAQGAALMMEADADSAEDRAAGVRHFIALLEMLSDKTEGRRTAEEEQLMSQLLFELRTGYLARFQSS